MVPDIYNAKQWYQFCCVFLNNYSTDDVFKEKDRINFKDGLFKDNFILF